MIYLIKNELFCHEKFQVSSVQECIRYLDQFDILAYDCETRGMDEYTKDLLSVQIGAGDRQYVIDTNSVNIYSFKELLESKILIIHNAQFDLRFLFRKKIFPTKVFDTFIAECVLFTGIPEARKSLDYCLQKYLKVYLDKSIRGLIHREGLSTKVIEYGANDIKYLHELKEKQEEKIKEFNLENCLSLENLFVVALAYIAHSGIKLDAVKWKNRVDKVKLKHISIENQLNDYIRDNFQGTKYVSNQLDLFSTELNCNILWTSHKQVSGFFKSLSIEILVKDKKTGKEKSTVDIKQLSSIKDKNPILPIYIEYKELEKELTTYGDSWFKYINPVCGRVLSSFKQLLNSGRISSGSKNLDTNENYPNLQNIPSDKEVRECFVAEEGNTLIVSDYSGQEINVFVNKSLEPKMLEFFQKGYSDMHSFIAQKVYTELKDLSLEEIKKLHNDKRQTAKVGNFAILYGAVPQTLSTQLGVPIDDAEYFYKQYFEEFSTIKKYFKTSIAQAMQDGYILIDEITGRKSFISGFEEFKEISKKINSEFWDEYKIHKNKQTEEYISYYKPLVKKYFNKKGEIERSSVNFKIQGTSASISKLAIVYLYREIVNRNMLGVILIPNMVHDEIVIECPINIAEEWKTILQECMERAGDKFCKTIPLKAEPLITKTWTH